MTLSALFQSTSRGTLLDADPMAPAAVPKGAVVALLMGLPWTTWPAVEMTADVEIEAFAALVRGWMPEPVERAA